MSYSLELPQKIVFGTAESHHLCQYLPKTGRVLVVSSASAVRSGALDKILQTLKNAPQLETAAPFLSVTPEPALDEVENLRQALVAAQATIVVAVGGGSVLDSAKTAAALSTPATQAIPLSDFFYKKAQIPARGLFLAALPTTAGTGAEITPNCVFIDRATGVKQSIRSSFLLPDVALVDPELTYSCPPKITASSGMDALTQGIESYLGKKANAATRALAAQAVKSILSSLSDAYCDPDNPTARSLMAEGSMMGAMAFASSGLGAVHGLAHPLGAKYHIPHGTVCGILLPVVLEENLKDKEVARLWDELSKFCKFADGEALLEEIRNLLQQFNLGPTLRNYALQTEDFPWIIANSRSGSMKNNPRDFSDLELSQILEVLL